MNYALILAGGVGSRVGEDVPKQFYEVNGKPIIAYSLETYQKNHLIDSIYIVISEEWKDYVLEVIGKFRITKFKGFALSGTCRQYSILNGIENMKLDGAKDEDLIIIHESARPNITDELITACLSELEHGECVMPALPVKDAIYVSQDGKIVSSLTEKSELFAGQSPESFRFGAYYKMNKQLSMEELKEIKGTSELAYKCGVDIHLIEGDENNYKVTTKDDLITFINQCK